MSTPKRLHRLAMPLALTAAALAAACKLQSAAEVQSVVGLQAGLDGQIRAGAQAPTFIALADWFAQFRIDNSPVPPAKDPAHPYAVNMKDAAVKKKIDPALLAQLLGVIDQESSRL